MEEKEKYEAEKKTDVEPEKKADEYIELHVKIKKDVFPYRVEFLARPQTYADTCIMQGFLDASSYISKRAAYTMENTPKIMVPRSDDILQNIKKNPKMNKIFRK